VGGDKLFVDYAGDTIPVIINRLIGEAMERRNDDADESARLLTTGVRNRSLSGLTSVYFLFQGLDNRLI
jgi:hypothetical protein